MKTALIINRLGDCSYIVGIFHRTIGLRFHEMELELNDQVISGENCFAVFCNSRFFA